MENIPLCLAYSILKSIINIYGEKKLKCYTCVVRIYLHYFQLYQHPKYLLCPTQYYCKLLRERLLRLLRFCFKTGKAHTSIDEYLTYLTNLVAMQFFLPFAMPICIYAASKMQLTKLTLLRKRLYRTSKHLVFLNGVTQDK